MGSRIAVALYVVALVVVIVGVDVLFLSHLFWPRLLVNIGIVVVFAAVYFWFLQGRLSAEQACQRITEVLVGGDREGHRAPGDELVRPDQEGAVLVDLADPGPVVVDVGDLAAGADDHGLDRGVEVPADLLGRLRPGLAGDAGKQRER